MDFPIENGGSFHCYVNVYQRVVLVTKPGVWESILDLTGDETTSSCEAKKEGFWIVGWQNHQAKRIAFMEISGKNGGVLKLL